MLQLIMRPKKWWPDHYSRLQIKNYEIHRESEKWTYEQIFIQNFLAYEGERLKVSHLLDAPSGTGRFFQIYEFNNIQDVTALDISHEMLNDSRLRANELKKIKFVRGDICKLPFSDKSFDYTVCWRFITWVPSNKIKVVLGELTRVTRQNILISIYFWNDNFSWRRIIFFAKMLLTGRIFKPHIRIQSRKKFYALVKNYNLVVEKEFIFDQNKSASYFGMVLSPANLNVQC